MELVREYCQDCWIRRTLKEGDSSQKRSAVRRVIYSISLRRCGWGYWRGGCCEGDVGCGRAEVDVLRRRRRRRGEKFTSGLAGYSVVGVEVKMEGATLTPMAWFRYS